MRRAWLVSLSFGLLLFACGRGRSTAPTSEPATPAQSTQAPPKSDSTPTLAPEARASEIPYTEEKSLSYAGYQISVEQRRVNVEGIAAEIEVAILKKKGRIIRVFDEVRNPTGALARFALVPVLGDPHKQLIIEQTGPREWAYWVVALRPRFRVIFKSTDYDVGHELEAEDLDGDGTRELVMALHTYWFFDGLCGACSPLFGIAFKYDRRLGVFRPANHVLKGFCVTADHLNQAEQEIKVWRSENTDIGSNPIKASDLYSKVLRYSLPLIYCGNGSRGWSFFDRLYNLPDRQIRKSRIRKALRHDRVYRVVQFDLKYTRRKASLHRAQLSG